MKKKVALSTAAILLALNAGAACADAKSGFGFDIGLVHNSMSATALASNAPYSYTNLSATALPAGTTYSYATAGPSLGVDYQIALSPSLSINPFLMSSNESATGGTLKSATTAAHAILGLQLRYWVGDVFFGGHLASYSELLDNPNLPRIHANGTGAGLVVGWEQPDGGQYVMAQFDSAKLQYVDANVKLNGARLSIGYRWK